MGTKSGWSTTRGIAAALAVILLPAELSLALLIGASTPADCHAKDKAPPTLDGVWKLNEQQSESFQQKMQSMRGSGGGPGGEGGERMGGRGGGGGRGGWGGGGGGMGGGMGGGGMRGRRGGGEGAGAGGDAPAGEATDAQGGQGTPRPNPLMRPPMMLVVEQSDSAVVLSERGNVIETLVLAPPKGAAPALNAWELAAQWKGEKLEADGSGPRGGKLHQSYELSKDGKQLIVVTRMESQNRPAIELKRVYDRYEGD